MAILLAYPTPGIASFKKVCRDLKMAAILKILKYQTQLQFDLRCQIMVPQEGRIVVNCFPIVVK